jgi:DNA-binding IclR family transcriptional regulator
MSVAAIADELNLPRATTHRFLTVLRGCGMVAHDDDTRRYVPGREFFRLGALLARKHRIESLAKPIMQQVVAETGETCLLSVYRPHDQRMMFVAQERAAHALGYTIEMNRPLTVIWGASGRAILAFLPEQEIESILKRERGERAPTTGQTLPPTRELRAELAAIREKGYSVSLSQRIPHAYSVAAPVLAGWDNVVGALSITVPEMRVEEDSEERFVPSVARATEELSTLLGHRTQVEATAR